MLGHDAIGVAPIGAKIESSGVRIPLVLLIRTGMIIFFMLMV